MSISAIAVLIRYMTTIAMRIPHDEIHGIKHAMEAQGWRLSFIGVDREDDQSKDLLTFVRNTP